jgi:hypothetical protein
MTSRPGRFNEIAEALRAAEKCLRVAVSIAGDYRGPVFRELAARDVQRKGVKSLIRLGELADKIEARSNRP